MRIKKTNSTVVIISLLILVFLPYCYLSFFSQPIGEDFGYAFQFQGEENFLDILHRSYFTMNGRYVANIFMYASPLAYKSIPAYKMASILLVLLLFIANLFFIKSINISSNRKYKFIYAGILSLLYLHNLPIISEGLYWYTAASIYFLGIIFTLFCLGFFFRVIQSKSNSKWKIFLAFLLFFLAIGFNEVLTLSLVFILLIMTFIFYKKDLPNKKLVLFYFLSALVFASLMVFAPGNSYRELMYPNSHNLGNSLLMSLLQTGRFGLIWVFSIPFLAASVLYSKVHMKQTSHWFINSFYLNKWFSLIILAGLIFICVFPPYWFTGILGQHRTLNVAYFFFLIMWFINLSVWLNHFKWKQVAISPKILFPLLIVGLMFTGNGYNALIDIFSGKATSFNNQLEKRNVVLHNAITSPPNKIIFSPISSKPKTLFVTDIDVDPQFWTNQGYNVYYKLPNTAISIEEAKHDDKKLNLR